MYDAVEQTGALERLGWGRRLYTFIIDGKKRSQKSSRKRISSCLKQIPTTVDPTRFYFVDRQTNQAAGDDVSGVTWVRGDGRAMTLPCFRG